jgi:hypothetical protein
LERLPTEWTSEDERVYQKNKCDLDWLYRKFRGICWICRSFCPRDQASRDHVIPSSLGGGFERDNQALAHKRCNTKRGNGYREILFKFFTLDELEDARFIKILEEHDLIVQFGVNKKQEGLYIVISKKREDHG